MRDGRHPGLLQQALPPTMHKTQVSRATHHSSLPGLGTGALPCGEAEANHRPQNRSCSTLPRAQRSTPVPGRADPVGRSRRAPPRRTALPQEAGRSAANVCPTPRRVRLT